MLIPVIRLVLKNATASQESGETPATATPILLNDLSAFFGEGAQVTLGISNVVDYCLEAGASCTTADMHTITLRSINPINHTATLTFSSTPKDVTFARNQSRDVDVTDDNHADLHVTLTELTDTTARFTFQKLAAAPTVNKGNQPSSQANPKTPYSFWWAWAIGAIVVLSCITFILVQRRKQL